MSLCTHPPASAHPLVLQSAPACWGATSLHAPPAAESLEEVQAHYLGMYATQSMSGHDIGYPPVGKLTSRYTHTTASQQMCATMVLCQLVSASHTVLAIQMYMSNIANNCNRYHQQSELFQTSPWDHLTLTLLIISGLLTLANSKDTYEESEKLAVTLSDCQLFTFFHVCF